MFDRVFEYASGPHSHFSYLEHSLRPLHNYMFKFIYIYLIMPHYYRVTSGANVSEKHV